LQNRLNQSGQLLDYDYTRLQTFRSRILELSGKISNSRHLLSLALLANSQKASQKITALQQRMKNALEVKCRTSENRLASLAASLDALSPLKTMQRGYIISQQNGRIIKSVNEINEDEKIRLRYADGSIDTKVVKE
ncbi:MAG: hypothetical protein IJM79_01235, partial [Erysipelotrichaceae bacterium]|nr:hypothetical protein [Erysipelotrichaceae bacterium]